MMEHYTICKVASRLISNKTMAHPQKLKLFLMVQKFYQTMGLNSPNLWNWRNLFFSSSVLLHFFGAIGFFLFKSTSVSEYGLCFFGCISDLYSMSDFGLTQWRKREILKLIKMCEKFIEISKRQKILKRIEYLNSSSASVLQNHLVLFNVVQYHSDSFLSEFQNNINRQNFHSYRTTK